MECPYFESQNRCSCLQHTQPHQVCPADIEDYCRRSRYVLCPVFNEAETIDLTGILEEDYPS